MSEHGWDGLPDEILLQILGYLDPYSISRLQLVSRKLQKLCLDDELWRNHCFEGSSWYQALRSRRANRSLFRFNENARTADSDVEGPDGFQNGDSEMSDEHHPREEPVTLPETQLRLQDMANWDPTFPGERVSWYDEFIQREGPTRSNWLQSPRLTDRGLETMIEARGVALYNPYDGDDGIGTMLAVSPLEDGSVCLWDINGTRGRQGGILTRSKPGTLFVDGSSDNNRRSKTIDTSVKECVSVDNDNHRAFFAVQSHLIEVDLTRLEVVNRESFEWSITTLSPVHRDVPLTVGTSLGIHLYDFRARMRAPQEHIERVEGQTWDDADMFKAIFDTKPLPPYASLSQPTPIGILHLPRSNSSALVTDDIYVCGRFSNILHYDRRKFPAIVGSIYSGALINSLAALPYPFSTADYEARRMGEMSADRVQRAKNGDGRTLVAGGGYKQKGSLEIYGLSHTDESDGGAMLQNSILKNRHTAASSNILSVANHGTKIVFSDGSGLLKWFERDGTTECRRIKIGHSDMDAKNSLFASMPASDDLARKILSTRTKHGRARPNNDNVLFWTGEKLGLISFTTEPLYREQDFEERNLAKTADEEARQEYGEQLREALERQADEARFLSGLDIGASGL